MLATTKFDKNNITNSQSVLKLKLDKYGIIKVLAWFAVLRTN